jgi:FkbM family methyltransferase
VRLYFGARIAVDLWQMMLQRMFYCRIWEPNVSSLFEDLLKPGDLFVDLGGHVGYFSLLASHLVGPEGRVVAVEALPANFAMLQANLAANGADNVRAVHCAASDAAGELNLYEGVFRNTGTSTTDESCGRPLVARVPARPLDEILTADEISRVAMIKIDIEGAELKVLRRLLQTLDRFPTSLRIVCEFDTGIGGDELKTVFDALLAAGFEAFAITNPYSWESYMAWRGPAPLSPIAALPEGGSDILLSRRPAA